MNFWWIDADQIIFAQHPGIYTGYRSIDWTRMSEEVAVDQGKKAGGLGIVKLVWNLPTLSFPFCVRNEECLCYVTI